MGTNYYASRGKCACCGTDTKLHIGKSSLGWCFLLRLYPERGLTSWTTWRRYLDGMTITDEYGTVITKKALIEVITKRRGAVGVGPPPYKDPLVTGSLHWSSWEQFANANGARVDYLFNLLRHKVDGRLCTRNAVGPWDETHSEFC